MLIYILNATICGPSPICCFHAVRQHQLCLWAIHPSACANGIIRLWRRSLSAGVTPKRIAETGPGWEALLGALGASSLPAAAPMW